MKYLKNTISSISDYVTSTEISLFPNPCFGQLTINSFPGDKQVKIIDPLGRVVINKSCGDATINLDLSREQRGVYFVVVEMNGQQIVKPVVLK